MKPLRLAALLGPFLLLTACAAPADRPEAAAADAQAAGSAGRVAQADQDDPLICEETIRTGTRVARRTCIRASERERLQAGGQQALGDWQRGGNQVGNPRE